MNRGRSATNPRSTASIAGRSLHPMGVPFPIAAFAGALATNVAFPNTRNALWAEASQWLLGEGVVMAD